MTGRSRREVADHSDRALRWQVLGRAVRPLRAAFTALAELDAAIRDAEV